MTALYIASKYEELFPPDVGQFASITEGAYSALEIMDCEIAILTRLSFDINIPSPNLFLRRILAAIEADSLVQNFARYFLELAYHEYEIVYLGGNFLSATAICLARAVVINQPDIEKAWDDRISYLSGYAAADVREPLRVLARAVFRQREPSKYRVSCCIYVFNSLEHFSQISSCRHLSKGIHNASIGIKNHKDISWYLLTLYGSQSDFNPN